MTKITAEFCEPNRPLAGVRLLRFEDEAIVALAMQDLMSSLSADVVGSLGRPSKPLGASGLMVPFSRLFQFCETQVGGRAAPLPMQKADAH